MCKIDLVDKLQQYHNSHRKFATRLTHYFGIPLLIFALMTVCSWVHLEIPGVFDVSIMWLLMIGLLAFYFFLDTLLALINTAIFCIFALIIALVLKEKPSMLALEIFLTTFIIGIALQFIGHLIEKQKPAFLKDASQLIYAPLYLALELANALGYKKELKCKMQD